MNKLYDILDDNDSTEKASNITFCFFLPRYRFSFETSYVYLLKTKGT